MDETKRLVLENFPVEKLPDEVRAHFPNDEVVDLTIESHKSMPARRTISEILDSMKDKRTLSHDPVERIRAHRDEWSRRDELHERIRRGEPI